MEIKTLSYEVQDNIAFVGFGYNDDKSMTTLGEETLKDMNLILDEISKNQNKEIKGVAFFSHKEKCFLAGADINIISSMKTEQDGAEGAEKGQNLYNRIEDLKIPTLACVNGVCLGGGTEFVLSCDKVIAGENEKTFFGLPEVKLGLIPGFGGTYRMPKKIGLPSALEYILSGKNMNSKKAKKLGLVEETYPYERLKEMASKHLFKMRKSISLKDSLEHLAQDNFVTRKIIFQKARENVLKMTKGFYQAPLKILDVMEAGQSKGRSSYLQSEAQAFGELCVSDQSKNLQSLFFMMEGSKKCPVNVPKAKVPRRGACLGAGTMGGGIAWLMSDVNMMPIMKDLNTNGLELGLKQASDNFSKMYKRKKISQDDFERKMRSIFPVIDFSGFKSVDLVVEAVIENIDIKKKVFAEVEKEVREDCLITSNTSSLSINEMAKALEKSDRFAGLHFFNPVNKMPLVEIIKHDKVSDETLASLYEWCLKVKKTPVIVNDGPGFLVNRILGPYMNQAVFLMEEGVSVESIEEACLNFGMPMGPARLMDEVGIDVGDKVAKILFEGLGSRAKPCELSHKFLEKGFLGKKNNKGFYSYDEDGKVQELNPEALSLIPKATKKMNEIEIQMRIFLPMINEAATCIDEKIVDDARTLDLAMIFGTGFPPFRGGLLKYADTEGLDRIVEALDKFATTVDKDRYTTCDFLKKLVEQKKKFYEI